MKFKYQKAQPGLKVIDSLPRIPLILRLGDQQVEAMALVDSGATINLLPLRIGQQLGMQWDDRKAKLELTGNLQNQSAIPVLVMAQVGDYEPVKLTFAWVRNDNIPLILGEINFFSEFRITFERYNLEFEITPKPK